MFSNEVCPLCVISGYTFPPASLITTTSMSETSLSASDLPEVRSVVSQVRSFRRRSASSEDSADPLSDVVIGDAVNNDVTEGRVGDVIVSERAISQVTVLKQGEAKTPPPPPPTPNLPRYIQPILPPNVSPSLYLSHLRPEAPGPSDHHQRHPQHPHHPHHQHPPPPPRPYESDTRSEDSEQQIPSPDYGRLLRHDDDEGQHDDDKGKARTYYTESLHVETTLGQDLGEMPRRKCHSDSAGLQKDGKVSRRNLSNLGERPASHSSQSLRPSFSGDAMEQAVSGSDVTKEVSGGDVAKNATGPKTGRGRENDGTDPRFKRDGSHSREPSDHHNSRRNSSELDDKRHRPGQHFISENRKQTELEEHVKQKLPGQHAHAQQKYYHPHVNSHSRDDDHFGPHYHRHRGGEGRSYSDENHGERYCKEKVQGPECTSRDRIGRESYSSDSALGSPDFTTTASTAGTTTTAHTTTTGEKDSLEGSEEESSPPPPPPHEAQHQLLRRLSLVLAQRPTPTPNPTPTTPTPAERLHAGAIHPPPPPHGGGATSPSSSSLSSARLHPHPRPPHLSGRGSRTERGREKVVVAVVATSTTSSLSSEDEEEGDGEEEVDDDDDVDEDEDDNGFRRGRDLSDISGMSSLTVSSGSEPNPLRRAPGVEGLYPGENGEEEVGEEDSGGVSSDSLVSLMSLSTNHSVRPDHRAATQRSHSFVVTHGSTRPPELSLTPIPFEIPHPEGNPLFLGRHWVFREMDRALNGRRDNQHPGVVLLGGIGTGKTAILEQLIRRSCFHDSDAAITASSSTAQTTTLYASQPTLSEPPPDRSDLSPSPTSAAVLGRGSPSGQTSGSLLVPTSLAVRGFREGEVGRSSATSSDSCQGSPRPAPHGDPNARASSISLAGRGTAGTGTPTPGKEDGGGGYASAGYGEKRSNLPPPPRRTPGRVVQEEEKARRPASLQGSVDAGLHVYEQLSPPFKTASVQNVHHGGTHARNLAAERGWSGDGGPGSRMEDNYAWVRKGEEGTGGGEVERLGRQVVAYHLCQADINVTCLVPDLVHSLAAYLCRAPSLQAYRDLLLQEPLLQQHLTLRGCIQNPSASLVKGVLEPLKTLEACGKITPDTSLILVDSLNEAEFHRADHGDTVASFLCRHAGLFPPWLKLVLACQSVVQDIVRPLPFPRIVLDRPAGEEGAQEGAKDLQDYIHFRIQDSIPLRNNVCPYGKFDWAAQQKFGAHLQTLSRGCFLHVKMVLDLIEHGHLVIKGANYKALPVNLPEVFLLRFNLKFSSVRAFERVANILAVCLAALYPLSLRTIFLTVNAGFTSRYMAWEDFCSRMTMLTGLLHQRRDGCYMFFHPAFREWLIRRDDSEGTKFLCGLRLGHALMAFRLSRVNAPLCPEKTVELAHHVLKAHIYKGLRRSGLGLPLSSRELQGTWVCLSSPCLSRALVTARNVFCPNVKVSRLLLSAGANPDARTDYLYYSPLLVVAAKQGFADVVSLLLEYGADANVTSELLGIPALCYAAAFGHCDIVRQLCLHGGRPSLPDKTGQCAPVHAALRAQLESLALLLQQEWPPVQGEPTRHDVILQCLVAAAGAGHKQIVEYLHQVTRGEALDMVDTLFGETATTAACIQGQNEVLQYLLEEGADTSATNGKTLSPLQCAAMFGEGQIAESLLAAGADPEQTDKFGRTALIVAASEGQFAVLEMLLSKGAQLERTDQEGLTALCWACLKGHVTSAHALCACGADVNHWDRRGRVPLHMAAYHGDVQLVQYLLERGAQLERVDTHGLSPLERAINRDNLAVVEMFVRSGAKLGAQTWNVASGKPEVLLLLLKKLKEDGDRLYKTSRLKEAAQCYKHALKRFPRGRDRERGKKTTMGQSLGEEGRKAFRDLKFHLFLNLSRCKRRLRDYPAAVDLATRALTIKAKSFQAYYARARAYKGADNLQSARADLTQALRLAPNNPDVRRLSARLQEESTSRSSRHCYGSDLPSYEAGRVLSDEGRVGGGSAAVVGRRGSWKCFDESNM